jgi:hypothetical protein
MVWARCNVSGRPRRVMNRIEPLLRIPLDGRALMLQCHIHDTIAPARNLAPLLYQARVQLPQWLLAACEPQTLLQVLEILRRLCFLAAGLAGPWECARELLFDGCVQLGIVRERAAVSTWLQGRCCHGWLPLKGQVLASERPRRLSVDERGRLHDATGPALEYRDGYAIHVWHGVTVEPRSITDPDSIRVQEIEYEPNAEVRRIMLERHGWSRYIAAGNAQRVDCVPPDPPIAGLRGARLLVRRLRGEPEPLVYLERVNSTAEPDGTQRRCLQRIDPKACDGDAGRSCHAAMASRWRHRDSGGRLQLTFQ